MKFSQMLCGRRLLGSGDARGFLPTGQFMPQKLALAFAQPFSSQTCTTNEQSSFTISYLMSSCGLSPEAAVSASRYVQLRTADQPDSVLSLLRSHDFTDSHISKLVRLRPKILRFDPSKNILPKLEFFRRLGIPGPELADTFCASPTVLTLSLKKRIIPIYNFLRNEMHLDDEKIRRALRGTRNTIINGDLEKCIVPKITHLTEVGVPQSNLPYLVTYISSVLLLKDNHFERTVKEVLAMGLDPSKTTFLAALHLISGLTKSTWMRKVEIYQKCGWSEDEFHLAFTLQPFCAGLSEKKITSMMDFFVSKMGLKPAAISRMPRILLLSLEKRVIPRCSVIKALMSKGLLEKRFSINTVLGFSDKAFLNRFVTKHLEDIPDLLNVYQGKVELDGLGFQGLVAQNSW